MERYESAKKIYRKYGVDPEYALDLLKIPRFRCIAGKGMT